MMAVDPVWDTLYREGWGSRWPDTHVVRWAMRRFGHLRWEQRQKIRILDLGCGIGGTVSFLMLEDFDAAGVDGSPAAIGRAWDRLAGGIEGDDGFRRREEPDLRVGLLTRLPWEEASFDAVIDNCAMTHNPLPDCPHILAEAHRVLKPGGYFYSAVFGGRTDARTVLEGKGHVERFTPLSLVELYTDSPFGLCGLTLDRLEWTTGGGRETVQLLLAEVRKRTP